MTKKHYLLLGIGILLICAITLGFSYAYWMSIKTQDISNVAGSKCFSIEFSEKEGSDISLSGAYPISDEDGMKSTPYEFTITNTCDMYATYNINMEVLNTTTLSHDLIKAVIDDNTPKVATDYPSANATIDGAISYTLLSGGLVKDESRTYNFRMWVDGGATLENSQNKIVATKIVVVASASEVPINAGNYIESLLASNPETMNNDDPDGNVRYMGANPNNYVSFNDELWRIIGVFDVKSSASGQAEKRVKLIRADSLGNYSWDSSASSINSGYGVNEWSQADIMTTLNSGAYWNRTSGTCYNGSNNSTTTCNFSSNGLTSDAKNLIENAVWNTGTVDGSTNTYSNTNAITFYTSERSNNTGKICSSGTSCNDTVERTTTWIGQVGLMYPSDYGYATSGGSTTNRQACLSKELYNWDGSSYSDCKTNDWLYNSSTDQWTLTPVPFSSRSYFVFDVLSSGAVADYRASTTLGVRPVVYLKSSVKITGGEGTSTSPYQLSA